MALACVESPYVVGADRGHGSRSVDFIYGVHVARLRVTSHERGILDAVDFGRALHAPTVAQFKDVQTGFLGGVVRADDKCGRHGIVIFRCVLSRLDAVVV